MTDALDETADAGRENVRYALAPGGTLGKYKLTRILGQGGMGVVWAAHDPDLERAVALKVLKYADASPQLRQRLLREARAMAKLKHPNVLTVYEVGTVGDRDYIAMELVEGTSLDLWLAARPPEEEVWTAILASGRGLAAAHAAGVVHRDFKPHNVLRSRDGRILVTDFGLARGMLAEDESPAESAAPPADASITPGLDETLAAPSKSGTTGDSLLDAKLTQTGALIGTPAYMAPEQFRGSQPDPRTDQFAFCVTAWQGLTGERPFKGQTIDELRKTIEAGVEHIPTKLPRDVRSVLVRGLGPRAEERWPSLEDLLDELERAAKRPLRRKRIVYTSIATAAMIASGILYVATRPAPRVPVVTACDTPVEAFAEAWSPEVKREMQKAAGPNTEGFAFVAAAYEDYSRRWVDAYQKTCSARNAPTFAPRIRCLENLRDHVGALSLVMRSAPPPIFDIFDPHGMFPFIGSCERRTIENAPLVPKDQPRRAQVFGVLARAMALQGVPPAQVDAAVDALEREAKATNWGPALSGVQVMAAVNYRRLGLMDKARSHFDAAEKYLRTTSNIQLEGVLYVGRLDTAVIELATPEAPVPPKLSDPRAPPVLHPELDVALDTAKATAQGDPMMLGAYAINAAIIHERLAQFGRYPSAYADAIGFAQDARKQFEAISDTTRAAQASAHEAQIALERGDNRALDDALFAARRADDALTAAQLGSLYDVDAILAQVAFARRNYDEAHRLHDKHGKPETRVQTLVRGQVTPPGRARVVAWKGDLVGDPRRAFTDPRFVELDVVDASDDGTFEIHAEPGWAIVAESSDARSLPVVIGATPPALALKPPTTLSGTARGRNLLGVKAFARYQVGASTWSVRVPVEKDGTFDLRGLPAGGAPTFGMRGDAGHGRRTVLAGATATPQLSWPHGEGVDVIVRSAKAPADEATVWVVRGNVLAALGKTPTRADLDARVRTEADVARSDVERIGATVTDAGREYYRVGDRHAVITSNATGPITVCAAGLPETTAAVTCKALDIKPTVEVEYPDKRYAAGMTPVVIELNL